MKLSEFKNKLAEVSEVTFVKPDGKTIPAHFHITEVGQINKRFIDCGGTVRSENNVTMQLWESIDVWHRLKPLKLKNIIQLSEQKLEIGDHEVEIEYQADTIGKFHVEFKDGKFYLLPTNTACLATDQCGIPSLESIKEKVQSCCTPGSGCC
jgi:Family of unknown function (DUF6428)